MLLVSVMWLLLRLKGLLQLLVLMHRLLLLLRPRLTPRWRLGLPSARHGRMGCVLSGGRSGMWLADLIRLVRLLSLVAHLGLLWVLLNVLPMRRVVVRFPCLRRLCRADRVLRGVRMPSVIVALGICCRIHA
jgi:hypothetical protein